MAGSWEGSPRGKAAPAPSRHRSGAPGARPRAPPPPMNCTTPDRGRCSGGTPPCTTPAYELHHPRSGAVLRGRAPVHASSYDSARERCSGGTPPCTPPHMTAHASSYEMHTPARFSYELHRSESGVVREWCSRRTSAAPSVEPSTEPQARADAPAASYGMTAASPCRSPRTRRARSPRSAAAKAAGSRQRFSRVRYLDPPLKRYSATRFSRETPLVFRQQRRAPAASRAPDSGAAVTPGTVAMAKKRKSPKRATLDGAAAPDAFGGNEKVRRAEIKTAAAFFEPFL